jgi:hypothetical protein
MLAGMTPVHGSMARFFLPMPLWPQIVDPRSSSSMGSVFIGGNSPAATRIELFKNAFPVA